MTFPENFIFQGLPGFPDPVGTLKAHGVKMGPTWVLSAPDGPRVGPMNLTIWEYKWTTVWKLVDSTVEENLRCSKCASQWLLSDQRQIIIPLRVVRTLVYCPPTYMFWLRKCDVYTVRRCYNAVNFPWIPYNSHLIARPWGRDMGWLLGF